MEAGILRQVGRPGESSVTRCIGPARRIPNERKIAAYRELRDSGRWQARYGDFPAVLFVTTSDHRRKRLAAALGDMRAEVITFDDLR